MFDCVTIGDNIATSLQGPLKCSETRSAPNLNSSRVINIANGNNVYHEYCIISVGTYDPASLSFTKFKQIRDTSVCKTYVWIKPMRTDKAEEIRRLAAENHDKTVTFVPNSDNVLPKNYNNLANSILNVTNN